MDKANFGESLVEMARQTVADAAVLQDIQAAADKGQYWEVAKTIGAFYNRPGTSTDVVDECRSIIDDIREYQGTKALQSDAKTTVVFGTSGWRGVIGEDFTCLNVAKVVRGIVNMMKSSEFLSFNKYTDFKQVQENGIVVFRDNRFMGDEFMEIALRELAAAGVKSWLAGECPTGVGSALVTELNAAGSINFTPSHNPMDYAGLKFNPADGGPAGPELTVIIEEKAAAFMSDEAFAPAETNFEPLTEKIDAKAIFTSFVQNKSKIFKLDETRKWLLDNRNDMAIVVDFMHGSSRGYVQALLGDDVVSALTESGSIKFLHENEDFSFHGVKPEPSAVNQAPLLQMLKDMNRKFSLAVALDPDADRIRFADEQLDIDMNRFGAIAYGSLLARGIKGGICSTAPSSDFALEIGKREGMEVIETAVGFKNFRQPLASGAAVLAFEESDGISCAGHTLEKCALAGLLLALESMRYSGKNLSEQYAGLREKYGYFYPSKAGAEVKGVSVDEWQSYKKAVCETLETKLYKVGDKIEFSGESKDIVEINTIDGLKVIFADKSWILLRPSGTEPKFRYYFELASQTPLAAEAALLGEYENVAAGILQKARDMVSA